MNFLDKPEDEGVCETTGAWMYDVSRLKELWWKNCEADVIRGRFWVDEPRTPC